MVSASVPYRRRVQVFEHETLGLKPNPRGDMVSQGELDRLWAFNDRHGQVYFKGVRNGIQFASYVGVIQVCGLTLEILPKADKVALGDAAALNRWQKALIQMLKVCGQLNVASVSEANLARRNHSLLDLYIEIFVQEIEYLQHHGLVKQYRLQSGQVRSLKGKLNFAQQIKENLVHAERFFTEHQVYDHDHLVHQILLRALIIVERLHVSPLLVDRIKSLKAAFSGIKEREITSNDFGKVPHGRKFAPYAKAVEVARMVILNYMPDVQGFGDNVLALLFDMNKLWEEYVYRMLYRVKIAGLEIVAQERQRFWANKEVRPDIVLRRKGPEGVPEVFVIDTKWKLLQRAQPADDDLKQMYVYNLYWGAQRSMLLYPMAQDEFEAYGHFHKGREEGENACKVGFVSVLNRNGRLDADLGRKVLEKLGI